MLLCFGQAARVVVIATNRLLYGHRDALKSEYFSRFVFVRQIPQLLRKKELHRESDSGGMSCVE